ncbi:MAG: ATP-binding cassette domain-containing protein [Pseudomonadota bacterium]
MDNIKCSLENVEIQRQTPQGNFTLSIPKLEFSTAEGNKIPIMGISGAGKSTLLDILAAMMLPTQGQIAWWFKQTSREKPDYSWGSKPKWKKYHDLRELRRVYFGFSFQDSTLTPYFTVEENLTYPQFLNGISKAEARKKAQEMLDSVSLAGKLQHFPRQLSGGERQRVALIQAIMNEPQVLFADEPTGSLDHITRNQVMNVLYQWVGDRSDRLLLWVTHHKDDPKDAKTNRALIVENGACRWKIL